MTADEIHGALTVALEPVRNPAPTFEAEEHRYTLFGRELPSVTTILGDVYPPKVFDRAAWDSAAEFGTFVHEAIDLALADDLDRSCLTSSEANCVDAALAFLRDADLRPVLSEVRIVNVAEWYAGTVDIIAADPTARLYVVDWKTGSPRASHALQTAAYRQAVVSKLVEAHGIDPEPWVSLGVSPQWQSTKRLAVYLDKVSGRYKIDSHVEKTDWAYFKAALLVRRFREEVAA